MPLELAVQFPFSVDTWSTCSIKKPHHFLTHAHSDHIAGINFHAKYPIYCSFLTMKLVLHRHPHLHESLFVTLKLEEPMPIAGDEPFTVTAFDANHCAGMPTSGF
ncbi:hypothetical protein O6H91_Y020300 [Diphasiastrum complanatum]|nr:hypothetical protein O6H91_Y020300 [Diphasiastrum complanatum]